MNPLNGRRGLGSGGGDTHVAVVAGAEVAIVEGNGEHIYDGEKKEEDVE